MKNEKWNARWKRATARLAFFIFHSSFFISPACFEPAAPVY
jgi:hypothetical protein